MNPNAILNLILNNPKFNSNPMMANAIKMYQQGNSGGLKTLAENISREKGINVDEIRKQIGM